jgi:hypothetical protein
MSKSGSAYVLACGLVMLACSRQPKSIEAFQSAPATPSVTRGDSTPKPRPASTLSAPPPVAQTPPIVPNVIITDQTEGPFRVGDQRFTFVKHVQSLHGETSGDDSTVEWWELRDAAGNAVYRRKYPVGFENGTFTDTENVDARPLKASLGQGVIVEGGELPSAPQGGWWIQVFGLISNKLTPLSGVVSAEGAFLGEQIETSQPIRTYWGQQPHAVSDDVLKFRVWTGNVSIFYDVKIDWIQGKLRPEWTCLNSQSQIDACRYPIEANPARANEMTFVRLFPEAQDGSVPKHIVVKPDSKIEYLEAEALVSWRPYQDDVSFEVTDPNKVWIHVKIDGQDGWVSGEEDFQAVGLPGAG